MKIEQALELTNKFLVQSMKRHLSDVETLILHGSWHNQTYETIADNSNYSANYLRKDVGPKLWRDLSMAMGETLSKRNFRTTLEYQAQQSPPTIETDLHSSAGNRPAPSKVDWGDAIDVSVFFGRSPEQDILTRWILGNSPTDQQSAPCRLIFLLGMGGIGKTALSIKVGQHVCSDFEFLIWRSLRNAPPLPELLEDITRHIAQQPDLEIPSTPDAMISQLLNYLRNHRCLLILDNAEALLKEGDRCYRQGYEHYISFFSQVGDIQHQSCLVVTSRELPQELSAQFGYSMPIRCLTVKGLTDHEGQALLSSIDQFKGTDSDWQAIIQNYAGNPLAIKIVASFVREVFAGDVSQCIHFLGTSSFIFADIRDLLDQQFHRLNPQEKTVMIWLAIKREPIVLQELSEAILQPSSPPELLQVMMALQGRALIEKTEHQFTLQPVVMEYVTTYFIEHMSQEICGWGMGDENPKHISLLSQYALIQVNAKDYVRETQRRLILQPVLDHLAFALRTVSDIEKHLKRILQTLQNQPAHLTGYCAGNIINVLRQLQVNFSGYDFSKTTVWQADLRGLALYNVNFSHSDLSTSRFSQAFGWLLSVAFSPDGQYLAAGDDSGAIHLWSDVQEQPESVLKKHQAHVWTLEFSPDSHWLASGSFDGTVNLWDVKTGQCLYTFHEHTKIVWSVTFSRDGHWLASSSDDGTIRIWDCQQGQCIQTLTLDQVPIRSIAFTPDRSYFVSGSEDHKVRLWDLASGTCIKTFLGHTQAIWSVDVSAEGKHIASGGDDGWVKLWDLQTGDCLQTFEGHNLLVVSVVFSPDGQSIASSSMDRTVRLWNLTDSQCIACFRGHSSLVLDVAFSADGQTLASGSMDRTLKLWQISKGVCLRTWSGYKNIVWETVPVTIETERLSNGVGCLTTGSLDGMVRVWTVADGRCLKQMKHLSEVHSIAVSPDGKRLVSGNFSPESTLKVWDIERELCLRTIPAHTSMINGVRFSHDGSMLASAGDDKTVRLFDVDNHYVQKVLKGHEDVVWEVAFTCNDNWLVSGSFDRTLRVWDVQSGQCLKVLTGHTNPIFSVACHPHKDRLISGSTDAVKLWSLDTGQCDQTLTAHGSIVGYIAFTPDGQFFATASLDKTIRIWEFASLKCCKVLQASTSVYSIAFSPDATNLMSGGDDGSIQVWDLESEQCIHTIKLPDLYEGMNIHGVCGISDAQKEMLEQLGATTLESP